MDGSKNAKHRSRRSKNKTKKRLAGTVKTITQERERTLPRIGDAGGTIDKVPSNAPTMAIAPSDYEHIFHEAAAEIPPIANSPPQPPVTLPLVPPLPPQPPSPIPPAPVVPLATVPAPVRLHSPEQDQYGMRPYPVEVQVTPDGYTLLGRTPEPAHRRIALPPHIVRASNQFSRAALARIARYLASRAEYPR